MADQKPLTASCWLAPAIACSSSWTRPLSISLGAVLLIKLIEFLFALVYPSSSPRLHHPSTERKKKENPGCVPGAFMVATVAVGDRWAGRGGSALFGVAFHSKTQPCLLFNCRTICFPFDFVAVLQWLWGCLATRKIRGSGIVGEKKISGRRKNLEWMEKEINEVVAFSGHCRLAVRI